MHNLAQGLCLLLALGMIPVQALAANSDTPGPGRPAAPGVYKPAEELPPTGVAVFWDRDPGPPWDRGVLEPIRAVLEAQGVAVSVFPSSGMADVDLTRFTKVITTSVQPVEFWNALQTHRSRFEAYVRAGGILELHLASFTSETNTGKVFPGGFVVLHEGNNYNLVKIADRFHRILRQPNGVTAEDLQAWDFSAHGFFSTVPPDASPIIREDETADKNVVTAELFLGDGKILATVQPVEWDLASAPYRENMILYRPHARVEVSLELTGCGVPAWPLAVSPGRAAPPAALHVCAPGDRLTARAMFSNTGLVPFTAEVKGGMRIPTGDGINLLASRHLEMAIPPGITGPILILEIVIPPGLPAGEYKAEAALLTAALGREISRSQVPVTVTVGEVP